MEAKNLISLERIAKMSEQERKRMIDVVKVSNISVEEKEENIRRLTPEIPISTQILRNIEDGMADIDDIVSS